MLLPCTCDALPVYPARSRGGALHGPAARMRLPYTCHALLMHFSCTRRAAGARMLPASAPGRGSPSVTPVPAPGPPGSGQCPRTASRCSWQTPGHGQPGLAAGQAGHQRGGRMSFPGRPGPRESAAGTSKVHGRYMRHGNARGRAFPGAGLPAAKGWLIPGPAVTVGVQRRCHLRAALLSSGGPTHPFSGVGKLIFPSSGGRAGTGLA